MSAGGVFLFLYQGEVIGIEAEDLPQASRAFFERFQLSGAEAYLGRLRAVLALDEKGKASLKYEKPSPFSL